MKINFIYFYIPETGLSLNCLYEIIYIKCIFEQLYFFNNKCKIINNINKAKYSDCIWLYCLYDYNIVSCVQPYLPK